MNLKILGSSSAGNCYILETEKEALMIECGVKWQTVLKSLDFNTSKVVGCLVSHEHGDHAKYASKVLDAQIPIYSSNGTIEALQNSNHHLFHKVEKLVKFELGSFNIMPFDVQHDAAEPFGYLIYHKECGTVLFATDTYYLKYKFKGLNNILIECNYRDDILQENIKAGLIPRLVRNRTIQSHMSYATCLKTLQANDLRGVNNIILIHLSPGNSNAEEFKRDIANVTGKTVLVAEKNMEIEFNKSPF